MTAPAGGQDHSEHAEDDGHSEDDSEHAEDDGHSEDDGHGEEHDDASENGETTTPSTGDGVVVVMTEFAFEPAAVTVTAGETVTFEIINEGSIPHEFRLSNAHRIEEHIASGHEGHGEDGGHHGEEIDLYIELAPGEADHITVTFPEDTTIFTEIACLIPGHYEAGMFGELIYS